MISLALSRCGDDDGQNLWFLLVPEAMVALTRRRKQEVFQKRSFEKSLTEVRIDGAN